MRTITNRGALALAVLACLLTQSLAADPALAQAPPAHAGTGLPGMAMPAPGAVVPFNAGPGRGGGGGVVRLPNLTDTAGWPSPVMDSSYNSYLLIDLLEFQRARNTEAARWDILGWYGGDTERVWVKSEGRYNAARRSGETDFQVLYGRPISPFLDLQAGYRYEQLLSRDNRRGRSFAVLGVQGLVPYGAEMEAALFVSQNGDVSARATFSQNLLLTQRLILLPRIEINAAVQRAVRYEVGAGINDIEIGVRLRYEFTRQFAPYVGISWLRSLGETARLREAGGQDRSLIQFVTGIRMWF